MDVTKHNKDRIRSWTFHFNNGVVHTTESSKEASEIRSNLDVDEYEICNYVVPGANNAWMDKTDWTPREALQFYADQKNFDTVDGKTRILDNGEVAHMALTSLDVPMVTLPGTNIPSTVQDSDLVFIPRNLALSYGLLVCEHCGYPENNHFDFLNRSCAHDKTCPGYKESVRKSFPGARA